MTKHRETKTEEQKSETARATNPIKKTSIIDFREIEALIPQGGNLTLSFTMKAPGIIRMLYIPDYRNLDSKSDTILNKPKPFTIETSKPETVTAEIREITEESKKYLDTIKERQSKATSRVEELKQAREKIEKEIQQLQGEPLPPENKTHQQPASITNTPHRRHASTISLSEAQIAAIPRLTEKQGQIMRLRYLEKKSMKDIAAQLGYTTANAYNHHNLALKNLAKITQKEDN